MEEDIKILEEFIEAVGEEYEVLKEKQALERVVKGYRKLEEENESLVRQYEYQGALMVNEYFSKDQVYELFIPKSKVKEKIEELDRKIDFLNSQLTKCYEKREKLGTETEIDYNEELIFNLENLKDEAWAQRQVLREITYGG